MSRRRKTTPAARRARERARRKRERLRERHASERAAWLRWGALVVVYLVSAVILRQCDVTLPLPPRPPAGG